MSEEVDVRVLKTIPEVQEFRPIWESWPGNADSDLDMYLSYLEASPEVERPHVLVVYRGERPDVMLVGRMERVRLDFKVGYMHLRPRARVLYFVYGGPRGNASRENCELLVREICRSLSDGEADTAYLNYINMDSELCYFAKKIPGILSRDHAPAEQKHFSAKLGNSIEEFYQTLSPKVRKNQRWQARKLLQSFPDGVRIRCFRQAAEIDDLVKDVETVATRSYQRGLGVGFTDSPGMRLHLQTKAAKGWLRGYVLYLSDRPCAFWIGTVNGTTFGSEYLGFDAEFGRYSPGMYLILRVIEGFFSDHETAVTEVDFATGHAQYKEVLGNRTWQEASLYVFAASLKGLDLSLLRFLTGVADKSAKRLLLRAGILQRIKKSLRDRARTKSQAASSVGPGHDEGLVGPLEQH